MWSSRFQAHALLGVLAVVAALAVVTRAQASDPLIGGVVAREIIATRTCQTQLGVQRTAVPSPGNPSPWKIAHHNRSWKAAYLHKWEQRHAACLKRLHARADALRTGQYDALPDRDLYALADQAAAHGGVYSERWGDASTILKSVCYEAVRRSFARFGTEQWAVYVVRRESGCNPGAVNTTYSSWSQRAQCIAQMIPAVHTWVDYGRCKRDLRYAVQVFVKLSDGGSSTGPWAM